MHQWNTVSERLQFHHFLLGSIRVTESIIAMDQNEDDDEDEDEDTSDDSSLSTDSDDSSSMEEVDMVEWFLEEVLPDLSSQYTFVFGDRLDMTIAWGQGPRLIADLQESDCEYDFRFRKSHLQETAVQSGA